jgi:formylglycine-generating enzyme required for sulfatase activity
MVALPDLHACIDRHEALIRGGSAEPADGVVPTRKSSFDEAQQACEAAGYRLCTEREWTRACAGPGTPRKYAYGDVYDAERCNTASRTTTDAAPLPGGSHPRCVTPEGVFDLSGNVWEWTSGADRSGALRELRGGCFGVGEDDDLVACIPEDHAFQPRDASFDGYGLRCCTSTR